VTRGANGISIASRIRVSPASGANVTISHADREDHAVSHPLSSASAGRSPHARQLSLDQRRRIIVEPKRYVVSILAATLAVSTAALSQELTPGKSYLAPARSPQLTRYTLNANAAGVIQKINNIVNLTVVSKDVNDLKAEYRAGFIQGKLQGTTIISARDNAWDNAYLTNPDHTFPKQHGPTQQELNLAAVLLNANYGAFIQYLEDPSTGAVTAYRLKRLLFRMLGIYHGATLDQPVELDFSGDWLPGGNYFESSERILGYETPGLTFMDVYFLNAFCDLMDVISFLPEFAPGGVRSADFREKCSAFLKRVGSEVILTHNTWSGFLSQTMTQTLAVNDDLITFNAATPGLIASTTDFGYNNKGIMFNETTHRMSYSRVKALGLWILWRAALAEQFAGSIVDFFDAISLDNTGTYLNGYMLVDANTNETGLVEMSYRCFVYYRSTGGAYAVSSQSMDGDACSTDYDGEMVTDDYLMGINYPASLQVRSDLQSSDNRPERRVQFNELLPKVKNLQIARDIITYTDPTNPLSIFGRWDLGYGVTDYRKQIPDGSLDSKVGFTGMVRSFMDLSGILDPSSTNGGFWMLYGTPKVEGKPFIWSESLWDWQPLRDVPDRLDGGFTLIPLYLR
jgi:phospholipase B-like protein